MDTLTLVMASVGRTLPWLVVGVMLWPFFLIAGEAVLACARIFVPRGKR